MTNESGFLEAFEKCEKYIKNINEISHTVYEKKVELINFNQQIQRIELNSIHEISNEVDENGKKKFTNETTRTAEMQNRLKDNANYQTYLKYVVDSDKEIKELEILIKSLEQKLQLYKKLLDYYTNDTNELIDAINRLGKKISLNGGF